MLFRSRCLWLCFAVGPSKRRSLPRHGWRYHSHPRTRCHRRTQFIGNTEPYRTDHKHHLNLILSAWNTAVCRGQLTKFSKSKSFCLDSTPHNTQLDKGLFTPTHILPYFSENKVKKGPFPPFRHKEIIEKQQLDLYCLFFKHKGKKPPFIGQKSCNSPLCSQSYPQIWGIIVNRLWCHP